MSADPSAPSFASPDDLPPVQPPSAGFLVQLFLVPGIIVAVIVVVWVMVDIAEGDVGAVRPGQPVTVRTKAYPGRVFKGKVDGVGHCSPYFSFHTT